ncbi:MAG: response regulator transcription factor [Deltaproteobacteria bacterium]|nr:response regulator transcription factor [Deltaproteobacteria bacterium]
MKVLLFDKNSVEASKIIKNLEDLNINADLVSDRDDVSQIAKKTAYDLIVLGIFLPGIEETEIIADLMAQEITTPVICFPQIPAPHDFPNSHSPSEALIPLLTKLQLILSATEGSRGARITFGPLILDPISHKVWRNNKEISLTPKEYTLLEFFIRHPNQILTRTMIANHVWNQNFDFFTNVIDVYINYLRKKIDFGYEKKLIHTVRGKGYILKDE